jgi:hypothetical protein
VFSNQAISVLILFSVCFLGCGASAQLGNVVYPEDYGATGDGSSDDGPAVSTACTVAAAAGIPMVFRQKYRLPSSVNLMCATRYFVGAVLLPDSNVTVTLIGSVTAAQDAQIFGSHGSVSVSTAPYVSVAWWGASASAVNSGPAFQAAGGSNRVIFVPPVSSCYIFNSAPTRPYSTLNPTSVWWKGFSNFKVEGYGACIKEGTAVINLYNMIMFDQDSDFTVAGLEFFGNQTASWVTPATMENSAISMMSLVRATFRDLKFTGSWGGIGAPFVGDYIVTSVFENLKMPSVGICFDVAFLLHSTMNRINAVGSQGAGGKGMKCLSIIYDTRNLGINKTGHEFSDTDGLSFTNSDISNFENPAVISSGINYRFSGNKWHHNPTVGTLKPPASVLFYYFNGQPYSSVGHPVQNVTIDGDIFRNNGMATGALAVGIGAAAIANSDAMNGFTIANSIFDNNMDTAVGADTTNHISNISIKSSNRFSGPKQKARMNGNLLRLMTN